LISARVSLLAASPRSVPQKESISAAFSSDTSSAAPEPACKRPSTNARVQVLVTLLPYIARGNGAPATGVLAQCSPAPPTLVAPLRGALPSPAGAAQSAWRGCWLSGKPICQ
jgi:hypothetical protein